MPDLVTNGVRTSFSIQGDGLPVLFIHGGYGGAASTLAANDNVITTILPQDRYRLITYDRRGAGQSEYCDSDYTLVDLAADALGLLDHHGMDSAVIVGSSAGGPIALQFALSYPERVFALCLPNTGANLMDQSRAVSRDRMALVERMRAEGARAVFESRKDSLRTPAAAQPANAEEAERQASLRRQLAELPEADLYRYSTGELRNFAAYAGFDFSSRLGELRMPVCVIHGTADQTVPFEWGRALATGIPQAEFHPIEGGVHGILANPSAATVLLEWLGRVAAPARA